MQRHRSVPLGATPTVNASVASEDDSHTLGHDSTLPAAKSLQSSLQAPSQATKLLNQADALAKMTFELHIRSLATHADRLEREVRALVLRTQKDEEFRRENTTRMGDIMKKIRCVQARMAELEEKDRQSRGGGSGGDGSVMASRGDLQKEWERYQRETTQVMNGFCKEVVDLRGIADDMARQLEALERGKDSNGGEETAAVTQKESVPGVQTRAMARRKAFEQSQALEKSGGVLKDGKCRIQETVNSTRRWNRDHKTTKLADSQFVANYLKQQSKRDSVMALHIQRSLKRRIRCAASSCQSGRRRSVPKSLEEFCEDVTWKDVIETVQEELIKKRAKTLESLG